MPTTTCRTIAPNSTLRVRPADLKSLADLARFPFTTKHDLRETYPFGMFAVPQEKVVRIHASSGTTGKPTVVGYTAKDIDTWASVMARSIRAAGGERGDIIHVAYGYGLFTGGLGAHYGAEKLGCTVIPVSGGMTERQVQLIVDFKPKIIMVTPSYMLIVEEMQKQGVDPERARCGSASSAPPWTAAMRRAIETKTSLDAIDIYGLSEIIGPGVAQECIETKDGLTVWEDHFYPEIIDPTAVKCCRKKGELVTSLTKEALPMIRYRTRDLTRLLPPTAQHAAHREDHRPLGRHADHSRRQSVSDTDRRADFEAARTRAALHARSHAACEPRRTDGACRDGARSQAAAGMRGAPLRKLEHAIKAYVGLSASAQLAMPMAIERSLGKAKRIVDRRSKE